MEENIDNLDKGKGGVGPAIFNQKMKLLFDEIDNRLELIGGEYGPILMQELHSRLERIVENFNKEVHILFSESFKKHELTNTQLKDLIKIDKGSENQNSIISILDNSDTPQFIRNVEFGPVRPQ